MKINLKYIIKQLKYWKSKDKEIQEVFDILRKTLSQSSHPLIIESRYTQSFLDGVAIKYPQLKEELEWYAWELQEGYSVIEYKGKKYDALDDKQYLEYLIELSS